MSQRQPNDTTEVGKIVSESIAYDNPFFKVTRRIVETSGGIIREPQFLWDRQGRSFSVVIGHTNAGNIILVREPKYGQMKRMLTAATGGVKKDETPLDAAKREFTEETGYGATNWIILREDPMVDFSDKIDGGEHYFFLATGAYLVKMPESEVVLIDPKRARNLLRGRLDDMHLEIAMSWVALTLALDYLLD
ncbi:MAG: NUDIX hydrolase [Candidatus Sungbacteria bacterium]|nr:NUDIX hydrolase [Candidatus Sungbacteria bacterium]